jgi:hypothetical protein
MPDAYVNIIRQGTHVMITVCDVEILGMTFKDKNKVLDIRESFYNGRRLSVEEAVELVKTCTTANLVGKNTVEYAKSEGIVHPEAVLQVLDVPHALIVRIQ